MVIRVPGRSIPTGLSLLFHLILRDHLLIVLTIQITFPTCRIEILHLSYIQALMTITLPDSCLGTSLVS